MSGTGKLRILLLAALAIQSACNLGADESAGLGEDDRIECRIGTATRFERFCTMEGTDGKSGRIITVRKPDGGFRRLLVTNDGRGVVAADGAEPAVVSIVDDGRIDVAIGGDVFRLPARMTR